MSSLPQIRPGRLIRALQRAGFRVVRSSGGHTFLRRDHGAIVNIPMHGGRAVPPGTLRAILETAGLTADELRGLL